MPLANALSARSNGAAGKGNGFNMEISLFSAAAQGFLNLLQLKVFLAMMVGVSIGTFTAVAPQGLGMPLAYAIAAHDAALAAVVDTWIDLKRKDGTIDELFAHWILGRNATPKEPRWSVLDNVLHWGRR